MRRFILATALAIAAIEQPLLLGRESKITPAAERFANTEIAQSKTSEFYYEQGVENYKSGDYQGAIKDFSKAIEIYPQNFNAYYNRGLMKLILKDYLGAISDFSKVIDNNDGDEYTYYNRGISFKSLKDYAAAIKDFSKVIEINPRDGEAFFERAGSKYFAGDMKGSCKDAMSAASLGNEKVKEVFLGPIGAESCGTFINKAYSFLDSGVEKFNRKKDPYSAISDINKAIELHPKFWDAYYYRALYKIDIKDISGAILDLNMISKKQPNYWKISNGTFYATRGWAYFFKNDKNKACLDWQEASLKGNNSATEWIRDKC